MPACVVPPWADDEGDYRRHVAAGTVIVIIIIFPMVMKGEISFGQAVEFARTVAELGI
jgi:hypothetical protein